MPHRGEEKKNPPFREVSPALVKRGVPQGAENKWISKRGGAGNDWKETENLQGGKQYVGGERRSGERTGGCD